MKGMRLALRNFEQEQGELRGTRGGDVQMPRGQCGRLDGLTQ